jgi:hypothetical protein
VGALRSKPYGPSSLPSPAAIAGALVFVVVAAVGGWILASHLASAPPAAPPATPPSHVRIGDAELVLRPGWRPVTRVPKLPGIDVPGVRAFAPPDGGSGRMLINVLPGTGGEVPKATVAALRVPLGSSERAKVAGIAGVGYTSLALRGVSGLVDVYAIGTPAGVLTIGCVAPIDDPLPVGSCPGDVLSVVAHARPAPDPRAALKKRLPAVMAALNAARRHDRRALRSAPTSRRQALPARELEHAYEKAAARLAPVAPKAGAGAALPAALRATARAYHSLSVAATHHSRRGWTGARARVTAAERTVGARVAAARR